ncbi:MAG: phosphate ABC transporter, permease protein PstA, partial [Dehalococcoidia bacterium]
MTTVNADLNAISSRMALRRLKGRVFFVVALGATLFGIVALAVLLISVAGDGFGRLSWDFISGYPSRFADRAGIQAALFGTLWIMGLT